MTKLVCDVEHTITCIDVDKDKWDYSPFNPNNKLVSVGWALLDDNNEVIETDYFFTYHKQEFDKELHARKADTFRCLVRDCKVFIAHNAKHDYNWLRECDFELTDKLACTFIGEYVLARGRRVPLDLLSVGGNYSGVSLKKSSIIQEYLDKGLMFDDIPLEVVEEYGNADVLSCAQIYREQCKVYELAQNKILIPTRNMMWEYSLVLADIERNGIAIDMVALDKIQAEYEAERGELKVRLREIVQEVMGDYPYNLDSPAQVSEIIYSRKVNDKEAWIKAFNIGLDARGKSLRRPFMDDVDFKKVVNKLTDKVYRTKARQCDICIGQGYLQRLKKDGSNFKKLNVCHTCGKSGIVYDKSERIAGFKLSPTMVADISIGGFVTDKDKLTLLIAEAKKTNNELAIEFLTKSIRLNAINTYIDSFCVGIRRSVQKDGLLHTKFNQCITSTGRLSSSDPNLQNQPRGKTFSIRRCFISRHNNGVLVDTDFAQLEFRAAAELSGCAKALEDILAGVDVHAFTSMTMTEAGQLTDRQDAKPHTFKPLFGGQSGTEAEQTYYKAFLDKYVGIKNWHKELEQEVLEYKTITLPSGRQYAFPHAKLNKSGYLNQRTQVVNWPVQGFATADVYPVAAIILWKTYKKHQLKSKLVLTVHDDLLTDVYPGEEEIVLKLNMQLADMAMWGLKQRYGFVCKVPLATETKLGPNFLDLAKHQPAK